MNKSSRDSLRRLDHVAKGLADYFTKMSPLPASVDEMKEMGSFDVGDTMMLIRIRNEILSQRAKWLRKKEDSRAADILRDIARLLAEHLSQRPDPPGTDSAEQYFAHLQRDRQTLLNIGFLIEDALKRMEQEATG